MQRLCTLTASCLYGLTSSRPQRSWKENSRAHGLQLYLFFAKSKAHHIHAKLYTSLRMGGKWAGNSS